MIYVNVGPPILTGIEDNNNIELKIFPNPTNDELQVTLSQNMLAYDYTIIDALGNVIINDKTNANNIKINLKSLKTGVYVIVVTNGIHKWYKKNLLKFNLCYKSIDCSK